VIINPGNFDYYQNGNTSFKGVDAYIMIQNKETEVVIQNNYLSRNGASAGFVSSNLQSPTDFKLIVSSPLVNQAQVDQKILFDFEGTPRPFGPKSDIGAFELVYDLTAVVIPPKISEDKIRLLQNPVHEFLLFSMPPNLNGAVLMKIYDLSGKMILQHQTAEFPAEHNIIQANISKLTAGTYIYTIRNREIASSGKFIKW